jgi:hypothetical protein
VTAVRESKEKETGGKKPKIETHFRAPVYIIFYFLLSRAHDTSNSWLATALKLSGVK